MNFKHDIMHKLQGKKQVHVTYLSTHCTKTLVKHHNKFNEHQNTIIYIYIYLASGYST